MAHPAGGDEGVGLGEAGEGGWLVRDGLWNWKGAGSWRLENGKRDAGIVANDRAGTNLTKWLRIMSDLLLRYFQGAFEYLQE